MDGCMNKWGRCWWHKSIDWYIDTHAQLMKCVPWILVYETLWFLFEFIQSCLGPPVISTTRLIKILTWSERILSLLVHPWSVLGYTRDGGIEKHIRLHQFAYQSWNWYGRYAVLDSIGKVSRLTWIIESMSHFMTYYCAKSSKIHCTVLSTEVEIIGVNLIACGPPLGGVKYVCLYRQSMPYLLYSPL